jgi:hypothetical protein
MAGRGWWVLTAGLALCAACASNKPQQVKLDDAGLARLNESQMEPVDDARIEQGRAHDALARARAAEADARARYDVAKSEREVSQAQLKRAQAERDLLKKQYADADQMARADNDIQAAQQRIQAADLKLDYLKRMIDIGSAERQLAEQHVETADARVEQAKYRAMQQANAPQVREINGAQIDQRVAQDESREAQSRSQIATMRSQANDVYNRWQQMDARVRSLARPEPLPVPPPSGEPTTR